MIKAVPFPWPGGKSRWATTVWDRLGDPNVYIEPFAGSAALLFRRPLPSGGEREIVVDNDHMISNFWRSVKSAPADVARHLDYPWIHADLVARREFISDWRQRKGALLTDPDYYDARVAAWWCWAVNLSLAGHVNSTPTIKAKRTQAYQSRDHARSNTTEYVARLSDRLKDVFVFHGDWTIIDRKSIVGDYSTAKTVGVVIDPPYSHTSTYHDKRNEIARDALTWAVDHGDRYRIVYFANAGDFDAPDGWSTTEIARSGLMATKNDIAFFSPACIERQPSLFA